jgi:hypothetical protein
MVAGTTDERDSRTDPVTVPMGSEAGTTAGGDVPEGQRGKQAHAMVGRYHLLELVGSGGMGVVWGAWDPELDRRVAIKVVHPTVQSARERILGEGQALARLSHPNVVPVYDVGVIDDQLYIVMEWVRGRTLRAYCQEPRRVREIVAIYRAAGAGLAAAHRAGLIHRDFKPDNAIVGDDGRVRVVDFGLARGEVQADVPGGVDSLAASSPASGRVVTRGAGTPRYMAPEQAIGKQLTPAIDQYAFGAALREALAGRDGAAPHAVVPRWLDEITARCTAADPADRYASMDALLDALARNPAIAWRRRLLIAGALGIAAAAFTVGQLRPSGSAIESCAGGADAIAKPWNDATRVRVAAHLRGLGAYGSQQAARLDDELRGYSAIWAAAHRDACLARDRGELTPSLYERSLGCLTRARVGFETVVELLMSVQASGLADAVVAARGLARPERCAFEAPLSTLALPAREIASAAATVADDVERARTLVTAQSQAMREVATAAAERAEQLGYPPLIASAQLALGRALVLRDGANAVLALRRAQSVAFELGDLAMAVEAYAREVSAIAIFDHELPAGAADAIGAGPMAEAIARGLDQRGAFARALLYNNLGALRDKRGDRAGARAYYQRALDAGQAIDGERHEIVQAWGNLARLSDSAREQADYLARGTAALERELGPDHPETLAFRIAAAVLIENPHASVAALREPCEARARLHPHLGDKIDDCKYSLGWALEDGEAQAAFAEIRVDGVLEQLADGYRLWLDGKLADVGRAMIDLANDLDERSDLLMRYRSVDARLLIALSQLGRGERELAISHLERIVATLDDTAQVMGATAAHRRRRARVEASLARALVATDRAAARQHAARAADWFRTAGGYDAQLAEMTAISGSP